MRTKLSQYTGGYTVRPFVFQESAHHDLVEEGSSHFYYHDSILEEYPERIILPIDEDIRSKIHECNDYDVLELFEDGTLIRQFDVCADDTVFFITETCNSNCVMCPMPPASRKNGHAPEIDRLIMIARQIPVTASHITITGGEPFMAGMDLFRLLSFFREKFEHTEFLILTNGRALAVKSYQTAIVDSLPMNSIIGIPLHAATADVHDYITRAPGSFVQTSAALRALMNNHIHIEVRIVLSRINEHGITELASLISKQYPATSRVCFMAMEMTGEARNNLDLLWISYKRAFDSCRDGIRILMNHGIDVRLYNFPLCTVSKSYWPICYNSISPEKIRYLYACSDCEVNDVCGGVFAGTLPFLKQEINAVS